MVLWLGRAPPPDDLVPGLRGLLELPQAQIITHGLETLSASVLREQRPRVVVSTLFWPGGDVLDAGKALSALAYAGPYRALAPPLPDRALIEREVRTLCPGLDFAVIEFRAEGLTGTTGPGGG